MYSLLSINEKNYYFIEKERELLQNYAPEKNKVCCWRHHFIGLPYGVQSAFLETKRHTCSLFEHAYKGFANVSSGEKFKVSLGKKQLKSALSDLFWLVIAPFRALLWTIPGATIRMGYDPVGFCKAENERLKKLIASFEEDTPEEYAARNQHVTDIYKN